MEISEILESCDVHIMGGMLNNPNTNPLFAETPQNEHNDTLDMVVESNNIPKKP